MLTVFKAWSPEKKECLLVFWSGWPWSWGLHLLRDKATRSRWNPFADKALGAINPQGLLWSQGECSYLVHSFVHFQGPLVNPALKLQGFQSEWGWCSWTPLVHSSDLSWDPLCAGLWHKPCYQRWKGKQFFVLIWTDFPSIYSPWLYFLACSFWLYFHSNYFICNFQKACKSCLTGSFVPIM